VAVDTHTKHFNDGAENPHPQIHRNKQRLISCTVQIACGVGCTLYTKHTICSAWPHPQQQTVGFFNAQNLHACLRLLIDFSLVYVFNIRVHCVLLSVFPPKKRMHICTSPILFLPDCYSLYHCCQAQSKLQFS
jgi:hypothetical protein